MSSSFVDRLATGRPGLWELGGQLPADALVLQLGGAGWQCHVVDLTGTTSKESVIDRFAAALAFPEWCGRNWDAFNDCIADLDWLPETTRRAVVVLGATDLAQADRSSWGTLVEILRAVAASSEDAGGPRTQVLVLDVPIVR